MSIERKIFPGTVWTANGNPRPPGNFLYGGQLMGANLWRSLGILTIALLIPPGSAFLALGVIFGLGQILGERLFRFLAQTFDLFGFLLASLLGVALAWPLIRWLTRGLPGQAIWRWRWTALAIMFAEPFLALGILFATGPATAHATFLRAPLEAFYWTTLWASMWSAWALKSFHRFLLFSLSVLSGLLLGLLWEWRGGPAPDRGARGMFLSGALLGILAFPWIVPPYQPALETQTGVEWQWVERPNRLQGLIKRLQTLIETPGECIYEPLGWADKETLVYRKWCGGRWRIDWEQAHSEWDPGLPQPPVAYRRTTGEIRPFEGSLATLRRRSCSPATCITPYLQSRYGRDGPSYFPGHFQEPLPSPDGQWVAFTARHLYGPEDLVMIRIP